MFDLLASNKKRLLLVCFIIALQCLHQWCNISLFCHVVLSGCSSVAFSFSIESLRGSLWMRRSSIIFCCSWTNASSDAFCYVTCFMCLLHSFVSCSVLALMTARYITRFASAILLMFSCFCHLVSYIAFCLCMPLQRIVDTCSMFPCCLVFLPDWSWFLLRTIQKHTFDSICGLQCCHLTP